MIKPVTPQEAMKARVPDVTPIVERINEYLKSMDPASDGCWWYSSCNMTRAAIVEVTKIYQAAGWEVRHVGDQRDGEALVFKAKAYREG